MEARSILIGFLIAWAFGLIAIHWWSHRKRLPIFPILFSHAATTGTAVAMFSIFVLGGGATVVQFVAYSEKGMDLWSLWVTLWPVLLFFTAVSSFGNFIWTIIVLCKKPLRKWLPVSVSALAISVLAFFAVGTNFPTA